MADKVKITLLRPVDGHEVGASVEYPQADAERLIARGAAKRGTAEKKAPATANKAEPALANKKAPSPPNKFAKAKSNG